jgi:NDP-sugar pyrophosphorylase family protein
MKAMLLSAGLGTRLAPFTNSHPKALAPVGTHTLLERNIRYLQRFGIREVIVNVHHFADQIEEAVRQNAGWGSDVRISDERDEVLETGGGLKKAAGHFVGEEAFLVMNVDVLTDLDLSRLISFHEENQALATLAVSNRKTSRYLLFDGEMQLCGWRNEGTGQQRGQAGKPFAFSGIQVISNRLLNSIQQEGKFSLIDVYLSAIETGGEITGFDHSGGSFLDVGKPESLMTAVNMFGNTID